MYKKKIFKKGVLASLLIALPAVLSSCGTSWIHWRPKWNNGGTIFAFNHEISAPPNLWKVRSDVELLKVWNAETQTINLNLLNNQYELFRLLGLKQITHVIPPKPGSEITDTSVARYWQHKDWYDQPNFQNYLNGITKKMQINFTFDATKKSFEWNFATSIQNFLNGFANYTPYYNYERGVNHDPKNAFDEARQYDVEFDGLDSKNLPVDFAGVANAGITLTTNPSVMGLMVVNPQFALTLSKLVNIPKQAFAAFTVGPGGSGFMQNLNTSFDKIFSNQSVKKWMIDKKVNLRINKEGQFMNWSQPDQTLFKGEILVGMLQSKLYSQTKENKQ